MLCCQKHINEVDADLISMCSQLLSRQAMFTCDAHPTFGRARAQLESGHSRNSKFRYCRERGVVPGVVETLEELARLFITLPSTAALLQRG